MARSDIINIARDIISGPGLGEKPSIRRAAASASISGTGPTYSFSLLAGEGAKVRAGDVLSVPGATAAACYTGYVLSVATDTVTVWDHLGSGIPSGTDLDSALLEQNPMVSTLSLHRGMDTIIGNWLYPHVFEIDPAVTVTPNLVTGQIELPSTTREILGAYQIYNNRVYGVEYGLLRNLNTTVSSTGVLGTLIPFDGSTAYLTLIKEITDATTDTGIQYMIATGTVALALDGTVVETQLESTKKDSQQRDTGGVGQLLWRSFLTQRQSYSEDLSRDTLRFEVYRG